MAKGTKKATKATQTVKAPKRNKFSGADDIWMTGRSIAVKRVSSTRGKNGNYTHTEKTTYYPRTSENMKQATSIYGLIRKGK